MSVYLSQLLVVLFVMSNLLVGCASSSDFRQRRSDDRDPLETIVEQLSQQVNSLNAEVTALKTKTASLDKVVAFHAWSQDYIHTAAQSPIILNYAATNIGNAYDTLTGVFTAPVSGLYDFQASFMTDDATLDHYVRAAIYVDSSIEAVTISDARQGSFDHGTMKAIVHINAGQKVYMKNIGDSDEQYYDHGYLPYTTFSGFLIKAD